MSVTAVPVGHFSGQRTITHAPSGADVRDLRGILNEAIAQANTNETNIFTYLGGFGCLHSLIALPESSIPQEVLNRVKK